MVVQPELAGPEGCPFDKAAGSNEEPNMGVTM